MGDMDTEDEEHTSQQSLWVERYAPQRYTDLLSEEVTVFLVALLHLLQQKSRPVPGIVSYIVDTFWGVSFVVYFDLRKEVTVLLVVLLHLLWQKRGRVSEILFYYRCFLA